MMVVTQKPHLFLRTQTNGKRTYLLLVENQRHNGKVQQRVLCRLGRLDELLASGQLDSVLRSLGRFSEKYAVLGAHAQGDSITTRTRPGQPGSARPSFSNASGKSAPSAES